MPTYLAPGVYIEELEGELPADAPSSRELARRTLATPIERPAWLAEEQAPAAAFVGCTEKTPLGDDMTTVPVDSWTDYQAKLGHVTRQATLLPLAVRGFFESGGQRAYVVSVGSDIGAVELADVAGDRRRRTGLSALDAVDDVAFVAFPDLMAGHAAGRWDAAAVKAAHTMLNTHCESHVNRFAILDPMPTLTADELAAWRVEAAMYDSKFATLYYPWLDVEDPVEPGRRRSVPPSGHVAGLLSRELFGEGFEAVAQSGLIRGVAPHVRLGADERDRLVSVGINPLLSAPGKGVRSWDATTLTSDPSHRDLRNRLLLSRIHRSIQRNTIWALFQRLGDPALWTRLRREITGFLHHLWRRGVLGSGDDLTPYHVVCDEGTNPPESVDQGLIVAHVAVALPPGSHHFFRAVYFS